jgi:hypothetical protein
MKCVGLQEKVQGEWVMVGSVEGKIGEVKQIHSKATVSLNDTSFNSASKEKPFVNR